MLINNVVENGIGSKGRYLSVVLDTDIGKIFCRYYVALSAKRGVIWVSGALGGWESPANKVYYHLASELTFHGISSLRLKFRKRADLAEAVQDVLEGIKFLKEEGVESIALVGHSFGGAVVIRAGVASELVKTVITISTQMRGTENVGELRKDCSIFLLHGSADPILPRAFSHRTFEIAHDPKKIYIYEGGGHRLKENAEEVKWDIKEWLLRELLKFPP